VSPPNATAPLVSVVLCARDAAEPLRLRLEGLCRQTLARDAFEVVVVDDGSTDGTLEVARAFEARLPLRASRQRPAGIASARNHGIFVARGVVLVFLDEGVPEPRLLAAHLAAHHRFPEPRFAVVGEARPGDALAADPLLRFLAGARELDWRRGATPPGELRGSTHFIASGASCKRTFLLERGVFNQAFRRCGEDVELAHRLSRHGIAVVQAPEAVTRKVEGTSVDAVCARLRDVGAAAVLLARLHPEPAVRARAGVAGAAARWRELASAHDALLRSTRELDRFVRLRGEEGLPVDAHDLALLERSYLAAFSASRARGIAEAEEHLPEPGASPAEHGRAVR
jgi:hypothetical protein